MSVDKTNHRPRTDLEDFYDRWSEKEPTLIEHDITVSVHKAEVLMDRLEVGLRGIRSVLDFGCGYGATLAAFAERLELDRAVGTDFSAPAIDVARARFSSAKVEYHVVPSLDAGDAGRYLTELHDGEFDCVILVDVLEHVADCRALVRMLSQHARLFVVKLPLENSVFDNYVRRKEYPGAHHSNGHLREFTSNDVHYFIRSLGLTPVVEDVYVYRTDEHFPPVFGRLGLMGRTKRALHIAFRRSLAWLLPKRWYLRLIGGGGYVCAATYDGALELSP